MRDRKSISASHTRKSCAAVILSFALLVLSSTGLPFVRPGGASSRWREARAGLMNPRHKFRSRKAPDVFRVRFRTTKGDFVVEARHDWAPRGADRFYNLARAGFFNDSRFFRVRAGFVA
jgi:hypothetical protein